MYPSKPTRYKLTPEAIANLKPDPTSGIVLGDPLEQAKTVLCIYIMKDHTNTQIDEVYAQIYFLLCRIRSIAERNVQVDLYNLAKRDGELSFHHRDYDIPLDSDAEMTSKNHHLTSYACLAKNPDYDNEPDVFADHEMHIFEELDAFADVISTAYTQKIEESLSGLEKIGDENL